MTKKAFVPTVAARMTFPDGSHKDYLFGSDEIFEMWRDQHDGMLIFDEPQPILEYWELNSVIYHTY